MKRLSIDWAKTPLTTDAEALAVWAQIAPSGEDFLDKLDEIPEQAQRPLAFAMLRSGPFGGCGAAPKPGDCAPQLLGVPDPSHAATMADPCLRRQLALWSIAVLTEGERALIKDALRALAALPPPESQLVSLALRGLPETDDAGRLELIGIAAAAGQRELANEASRRLDEPFLIEAVQRLHLDGALEVLSPSGHRPVYLAAVVDDKLPAGARVTAIRELVEAADPVAALPADLVATLVRAAAAQDCEVAAAAARALELRGLPAYVPKKPRVATQAAMMRGLCVLASYERLRDRGERSLLETYVPPRGLEQGLIEYDALSDSDPDGDGDVHTRRTIDLVPRAEVELPEPEDLARAMKRCDGTVCTSQDREFRFTFKPSGGQSWLTRLEVIERPPCP